MNLVPRDSADITNHNLWQLTILHLLHSTIISWPTQEQDKGLCFTSPRSTASRRAKHEPALKDGDDLCASSIVQKFTSSTCLLAQQFATWGERPASLCGGNTLSSQELQTPCQHDQLLLDNVNNSRPQQFSLRSDQRLEGSDAQVGGTTCWSSSSVMLVVFSRASTSSKLWHWRIWKKQVFSSVSSEQKHKKRYLYFVVINAKIIIVATLILSISSWFPALPWLGQS